MIFFLTLLLTLLTASLASANCVTFDLAAWTPEQRKLVSHVVATAASDSVKLTRLAQQNVQMCAPTADLSSLNVTTLQSAAQARLDAQATAAVNRDILRDNAGTRVRNNNLCTATFIEIEQRIEAERLAVYNAITASTTLTDLKAATRAGVDKYATIMTKTLECVFGRAALRGEE